VIGTKPDFGGGLGKAIATVDPQMFLHLFDIGNSAGMSVTDGAFITSAAIDQALDATLKEIRTLGLDRGDAFLARLTSIRDAFDSGKLSSYFKTTDQQRILVDRDLLRAMAVARCETHWDEPMRRVIGRFDITDLQSLINRPAQEEDGDPTQQQGYPASHETQPANR
jgi:hypothetical protein